MAIQNLDLIPRFPKRREIQKLSVNTTVTLNAVPAQSPIPLPKSASKVMTLSAYTRDLSLWGIPRWPFEPKMERIRTLVLDRLGLRDDNPCIVSFENRTAFKKVYKVIVYQMVKWREGWEEKKERVYHLSVRYPLQESDETLSEVATMKFARKLGVPAPRVIAWDANRRNKLGFEWILMRQLEGKCLKDEWEDLSFAQKEKVVKSIAKYQAKLYATSFDDIGNLFDAQDADDYITDYRYGDFSTSHQISREVRPFVGRLISIAAISDRNSYCSFPNSSSYLEALLVPIWKELSSTLRTSTNEEEMIEAQSLQKLVQKVHAKILQTFPEAMVSTVLVHDDLSMRNILIDDMGNITGILGWEDATAMPTWKATQYPQFLSVEHTQQSSTECQESIHEDVEERIEVVRLRRLYDEEMAKRVVAWKEEINRGKIRRELEFACKFCSVESCVKEIEDWVNALETNIPIALVKQ
ncbi:putative kinase-like protein [Botrytis fragariae]|uniref:non-specific serine/threonine protein kinase n=1 Tax=Botrytis fragariae TaxID=1964551 RepID=A0A8H6B059_9HELO|nr:putative kinase-like protein [Botrytis fragariae]KAF5876763.1 putative kinase-like protein [Botrytis fragariae]